MSLPAIEGVKGEDVAKNESEMDYEKVYEDTRMEDYSLWFKNTRQYKLSHVERIFGPWHSTLTCYVPPEVKIRTESEDIPHVHVQFLTVFGALLIAGYERGQVVSYDLIDSELKVRVKYATLLTDAIECIITNISNTSFVVLAGKNAKEFKFDSPDQVSFTKFPRNICDVVYDTKPILVLDNQSYVYKLICDYAGLRTELLCLLPSPITKMVALAGYIPASPDENRPIFCSWKSFGIVLNLSRNSGRWLEYYKKFRLPDLNEWNVIKYAVLNNHLFYAETNGLEMNPGKSLIYVHSLHHFGEKFNPKHIMVESGLIRDFSLQESLLIVHTSANVIEIFDAVALRKTHHILPGYAISTSILINGYLVMGTYFEGRILSFKLNDEKRRLCRLCEHEFPTEDYFYKICEHYMPYSENVL